MLLLEKYSNDGANPQYFEYQALDFFPLNHFKYQSRVHLNMFISTGNSKTVCTVYSSKT